MRMKKSFLKSELLAFSPVVFLLPQEALVF